MMLCGLSLVMTIDVAVRSPHVVYNYNTEISYLSHFYDRMLWYSKTLCIKSCRIFTKDVYSCTKFMQKSPQLIKKFHAFCRIGRFITCLPLGTTLNQMNPVHTHTSFLRSISVLCSWLFIVVPSSLFPWGSPTKSLHASLICPMWAACPIYLILFDDPMIFGEQ